MTEQNYNLIHNFEVIADRPRFQLSSEIKSEEKHLKSLIAQYSFRDKVKCGIASCGTKHNDGFLVMLNDGTEIIIGNKCGKRYFDVDFTEQRKAFNAKKIHADNFMFMKEAFENLDKMKKDFYDLIQPEGAMSFYQIKKAIFIFKHGNENLDYYMIRDIESNIDHNGNITELVPKSDLEKEADEFLKPVNYMSEMKRIVKDKVDGYSVVFEWHNAEALKVYFEQLFCNVKNPVGMRNEDFKKALKQLRQYSGKFEELKRFMEKGNIFFKENNLLKIVQIFRRSNDAYKFKKYANQYA